MPKIRTRTKPQTSKVHLLRRDYDAVTLISGSSSVSEILMTGSIRVSDPFATRSSSGSCGGQWALSGGSLKSAGCPKINIFPFYHKPLFSASTIKCRSTESPGLTDVRCSICCCKGFRERGKMGNREVQTFLWKSR